MGAGNVYRRKGRPGWYTRIKGPGGRWQHRRVPGETKTQARINARLLSNREWEIQEGLAPPRADVEVTSLKTAWLATIKIECQPRTAMGYAGDVEALLDWLRRDARLGRRPLALVSHITLAAVRRYAAQAMGPVEEGGRGLSARTVQKQVGALRQMLKWATEEQPPMASTNPLARWKTLTGPPRKRRKALAVTEIARLLSVLSENVGECDAYLADAMAWEERASSPWACRQSGRRVRGGRVKLHIAWELYDSCVVFLGTGVRPGELVALEWADVDFERAELTVRSETRKRGGTLHLPLREDVLTVLRRRLLRSTERQGHVFTNTVGKPWGAKWGNNLVRRLKPFLKRVGLGHVDLHTLRHTFGSQLIANNANVKDVQALMGHSSATVTLDIYGHAFPSLTRLAVERMPLPIVSRGAYSVPRAGGE